MTRTNRPCDVRVCVCVVVVDESSPGKMRKDNSNNAAQPDHRSVDYNQWLRGGGGHARRGMGGNDDGVEAG